MYKISLIACALILGGCFSPWKGDEGTIRISIGSQNGRAAENADFPAGVVHTITLSGDSGPRQEQTIDAYHSPVYFSVAPGWWDISVTATLEDKPYANGSDNVHIKPGSNKSLHITMTRENDGKTQPFTFTVTFSEFKDEEITLTNVPNDLQEITITVKENYDSYQWYIDGTEYISQQEATNQLTIHDLPSGVHRVTAVVVKDNVPYSKIVEFTVQ